MNNADTTGSFQGKGCCFYQNSVGNRSHVRYSYANCTYRGYETINGDENYYTDRFVQKSALENSLRIVSYAVKRKTLYIYIYIPMSFLGE